MRILPSDQRHLDRALSLAADAAAFASPNPTVGCVLTLNDSVLGEGAHRYEHRDHAEIVALKAAAAAGHAVRGATAYVTLEPCSHHGRTGPCSEALVAAGIRRCVVATVDPNPLVRGGGLRKLRAAGVAVDLLEASSPLAQRARRLNDAFAFAVQHGRSFVTLKGAVSRDGKLAPAAEHRSSGVAPFWLTGPAARADVQRLRHGSDAILTGIGTVLADDPSLTDRTGLPRRLQLKRVLLDSALRLPLSAKLLNRDEGELQICTAAGGPQERVAALAALGAEVVRLPAKDDGLDLHAALAILAAAQVRSVLVEAGSAVNGALLRAGLVDKLVVYTAPVELGQTALPFAQGVALDETLARLTSPEEQSFPNGGGEDVRGSGYLHDPWEVVTV